MDNRPQVSDVLRDHKEAAETLRLLMWAAFAVVTLASTVLTSGAGEAFCSA